MKDNKQ